MTGHARSASAGPARRYVAKKARLARRLVLATVLAAVGASALATSGFGQLAGETALTANRFVITIDGRQIASFQELSGITEEVETGEYWEINGDDISVNKLPGKATPPTVTLKRAMTNSMELWAWHEAVRQGTMGSARRSAMLTAFNADGRPVAKWWLEKAWPSKIDAGTLKSGTTQIITETVTLSSEFLQRLAP